MWNKHLSVNCDFRCNGIQFDADNRIMIKRYKQTQKISRKDTASASVRKCAEMKGKAQLQQS